MKYSLCLLMESKNNFALLSVFLPTRGIYIQLRGRLKKVRRNMPEGLVFPHIAALFVLLYRQYGFDKEAPHCTKKQTSQVRSSFWRANFCRDKAKR